MSMPVMMLGSRRSPACSRKVAGSSVCPAARHKRHERGSRSERQKVSVPYMATCQSSVSATNLPIEVTKTIATENAPYTTE